MDANTIMIMGMFITIIIGLAAILKFQFQLNDKIQKMETELKDEITNLKIEIGKINGKFDGVNKDYQNMNEKINDAQNNNNVRFLQMNDNYQNMINRIIDKIDVPRTVVN